MECQDGFLRLSPGKGPPWYRDPMRRPSRTRTAAAPKGPPGTDLAPPAGRLGVRQRPVSDTPPERAPIVPDVLQRHLAGWYTKEKRELPWRRMRDPWAVWVSEIMLQQTRVEVVIPRFEEFLQAFPDPAALAHAPEERALALWSGLGYYSRARRLRAGAGVVVARFGGTFPRDWKDARAIPGIGAYTASAILSIAYDQPYAVVDGNVARVLSRLFRLDPPDDRPGRRTQELADFLLDRDQPGNHNQAMMELGALICRPRGPRCGECPVASLCGARRDGEVDRYPRARARRAPIERHQHLFLLRDAKGRLLLERGAWPILPHLWLPVIRDTDEIGDLPARFRIETLRTGPTRVDLSRVDPSHVDPPRADRSRVDSSRVGASARPALGSFRHSITHHRLRFEVHSAVIRTGGGPLPAAYRLVDHSALAGIGRSSIIEKALARERVSPCARRAREKE